MSQFNITNLKNECFGGEYENPKNLLYDLDYTKSKNAYILFYERKFPKQNDLVSNFSKDIPQDLSKNVWKENINYLRARLFYDYDYFNFIKEYVCLYEFSSVTEVKKIISYTQEDLK